MLARGGSEEGHAEDRRSRVGRAAALAGFLVCGFSLGVQAAECDRATRQASPHDLSVEVRRLQTKLMVAALSCEDSRPAYNDFVVHFRPALRRHGDALKAKFRREYGGGYQSKLDSFVTLLANQASQQSNLDRATFCAEARATFARLQSAGPRLDDIAAGKIVERTAIAFQYPASPSACPDRRGR